MKWRDLSLAEITSVVTKGTTPTTYGMPFVDEGVNFVKAEALNGNASLNRQGFAYISSDTHAKLSRSQLKAGDVLVTIAGVNVGQCGFVRVEDLPANTNQAVGIVRVLSEKALPRFVYYFFKLPSTKSYCQSIGGQSAQPNVNLANLKSIRCRIPDILTQDRICSVLSAYDDLITNNQRRVELLEQSARLLYREWFVRLKYPGHERDEIVDGVPEGWQVGKLRDFCDSVDYGYTASAQSDAEGAKFLRITDIVTNVIDWDTVPFCAIEERKRHRFNLREGDIVVARTGATVGYAKRLNKRHPESVFASYLVRLRPQSPEISVLMGIFVTSDDYKKYVLSNVGGAAQPNANAQVLSNCKFIVPPDPVLSNFGDFVSPVLDEIEILAEQNVKLRKARDLLLPRLMDGRISV